MRLRRPVDAFLIAHPRVVGSSIAVPWCGQNVTTCATGSSARLCPPGRVSQPDRAADARCRCSCARCRQTPARTHHADVAPHLGGRNCRQVRSTASANPPAHRCRLVWRNLPCCRANRMLARHLASSCDTQTAVVPTAVRTPVSIGHRCTVGHRHGRTFLPLVVVTSLQCCDRCHPTAQSSLSRRLLRCLRRWLLPNWGVQ